MLSLLDADRLLLVVLVLARVAGLLLVAPVYVLKDAPLTVRTVLAVVLAMLIVPSQPTSAAPHGGMLICLAAGGGEFFIGVCLGLAVMTLLAGAQMAGELVSRVGGLTLSDVFDPIAGEDSPLGSRLMLLVCTAIFLLIGGHRVVMAGLLDSFHHIPPGGGLAVVIGHGDPGQVSPVLPAIVDTLVLLVNESFALAIRISVPVLAALTLATLVLGLLGRAVPQLNVLTVGFGLNSLLTFAVLWLSLGAAAWAFQRQIEPALQAVFATLHLTTL
jgi:flagellar biosynthesis protein FliR